MLTQYHISLWWGVPEIGLRESEEPPVFLMAAPGRGCLKSVPAQGIIPTTDVNSHYDVSAIKKAFGKLDQTKDLRVVFLIQTLLYLCFEYLCWRNIQFEWKSVDQWTRTKSSEINTYIHKQLICNKCAKTILWGKD